MIYWTPEDQKNIEKYINTTDLNDKHRIFNSLYETIKTNAKQVYFSYNRTINEDEINDLIVFVYEKVLPKIKPDKVLATQQLIWISLNRKVINNFNSKIKRKEKVFENINDFEDLFSESFFDVYETEEKIIKQRLLILNELDKKIEEQKVINKTNSIFLILLKDYLVTNNFDATGFRTYVITKMKLKNKSAFWNICYALQIKSKIMNDEKKI